MAGALLVPAMLVAMAWALDHLASSVVARGADSTVLLRGGTVVTMDDAFTVVDADVRIGADGRIAAVAPGLPSVDGERVIDVSGRVILPGFIQTHVHLCQVLFRNLADDLFLLDWLSQRIWPLEGAHTPESLSASAQVGLGDLLLGGTTGIVDMGTVRHTEVILDAIVDSGMRAVAGKCMMDREDNPAVLREGRDASLRDSLALADRYDGAGDGRLRYGFAPRFVLSCSEGLLRDTAAEARRRDLWLHTHASENTEEVRIVLELSGGVPNVTYLAQMGVAGPKTVLAHCIHLDPSEVAQLAEHGTHVAHCPSANLKLGSGICDVAGLLAAGVSVSIGADGAPCNNKLDAFTELRTAALLQKVKHTPAALPARQALRAATRSGAAVLGMEHELGQVRPGFRADLQVLQLDDLLDGPGGDLHSRLVYAASRSSVEMVIVDGRVVVEDRQLVALDRQRVLASARQELRGCLSRAGLSA